MTKGAARGALRVFTLEILALCGRLGRPSPIGGIPSGGFRHTLAPSPLRTPWLLRAAEAKNELSTGSTGRWGGKWLVQNGKKTLQIRTIRPRYGSPPGTF